MIVEPLSFVICAFLLGLLLGSLIIPPIVDKLQYILAYSSQRAEQAENSARSFRHRQIRRTKAFRERLAAILDSIEESSQNGKNNLTVTYVNGCWTDEAIYHELVKRKFRVNRNYMENNSMRITWG
jgi:predicted PurR-regulated permease PerM